MSGANSNTAEGRKVDHEALLKTLGGEGRELASSCEWLAYLRFVAAFRRYSFQQRARSQRRARTLRMPPGTAPGSSWAASSAKGRPCDQDSRLLHEEDRQDRPGDAPASDGESLWVSR
jgi:hypothetical protein